MAETYSLATVGRNANSPFTVTPISLPDSAGRLGSEALAMRNNSQLLCKKPDGSQAWFTIDAERSTPGNVVMKAVGP